MAEADGALDKARKHKKRQLQDTLNLVLKKRKVATIFHVYFIYLSFIVAVLDYLPFLFVIYCLSPYSYLYT